MSWYMAFADTSVILLFVALGIFGYMAARTLNARNFQFQVSVIVIVWILGELTKNVIELSESGSSIPDELGMWIHMAAMAAISVTFWTRFYLSKRSGRRFIDEISS